MDEKILKNQTVKKILEYLEKTALEHLDFVKISGKRSLTKKLNMKYMGYVEEDLENYRILKRYYENPETVKVSEEMINKKMEADLEFFSYDRLNEVYDDDWSGSIFKSFDIGKPVRNPEFHEYDTQKILKNPIDEKILEYLEEIAIGYSDFMKLLEKKNRMIKWNNKMMRYMEEDLENYRILKKYYENPENVKLSKEMKNKKMEVDLEFFSYDQFNRINDNDWSGSIFKSFDIRKPVRKF